MLASPILAIVQLSANRRCRNSRRRGFVLIAVAVLFVVMCLFLSLAVDLGRVQLAKTQLESATDAAARYAACGLRSTMLSTSGAIANAQAVLADNVADGAPVPFNSATDLTTGIWTPSTKSFTAATVAQGANAVKITTNLTLGDSSHPLSLLSIFSKTITISATAIAMVNGKDAQTAVSAKGNPWLAGMPNGTLCTDFRTSPSEQDSAGTGPNDQCSPAMISVASLGGAGGAAMTFDGVTGGADFGGGAAPDADGDPNNLCNLGSPTFGSYSYFTSPMNGMSNCHAPVDAMMGVFLDDNNPSSTAAPSPLDFGTSSSRDFTSLSPALKQVFFIGDGRRADGEVQQFIVPSGATRLFIANMDGWQYNNNVGGYNLTVHATQTISMVYLH